MRFHLVALPHTNVNTEHTACAFNQKVLKFSRMMRGLGHEVYLYSSEVADDVATNHIVCISEEERIACLEGRHYTEASFDVSLPHWQKFNQKVVTEIGKRIEQKDFICIIGGLAHKPIADAFPSHMTVEFGIGYPGVFSKYKVFESYAWMHTVYGSSNQNPGAIDGQWFDDVIPSYFDLNDFPLETKKEDYYLFVGRLTDRKGYSIAQEVCKKLGAPLYLAGPGKVEGYGVHLGVVNAEERSKLMGKAKALFVPTIYIEPFGSVAVEAQLCGTPVISTDWGAFTETVIEGVTGYRCRTFNDFLEAAKNVEFLDSASIRQLNEKYSLDNVAVRYQTYFERLLTLWGDGWYNVKQEKQK